MILPINAKLRQAKLSKPHGNLNIAIIGAGISGLSCANYLQNAGLKVTIFDKSRGPSGRISTRVVNDGNGNHWECDHGAQYFTARSAEFIAQVARWQNAGVAQIWHPRLKVIEDGQCKDRTLTSNVSIIKRYVGTPRMTSPSNFLASQLSLVTSTTISQITYAESCFKLSALEYGGLSEVFDIVLLAIPAPQASALLRPINDQLTEIANSVTMRGCWALMVHYEESLALPFDGAFVNGNTLSWVARNSAKPGRLNNSLKNCTAETWLLHGSTEWSDAHIEDESESVTKDLISAFNDIGKITNTNMPTPVSARAHRWRYANSVPLLTHGSVWSNEAKLGLCSEWLNGGKVEGAWLSGVHLARQVIQSI